MMLTFSAGAMHWHCIYFALSILPGLLETTNLDVDITDPISDSFYHGVWNATASRNTFLFEELFSVIPTDSIHTRKASKEFQMKTRPLAETFGRDVHQRLGAIRGRLVHFPLNYLRDEDR